MKEELQKIKAELAHERQMREESKKNVVEIVEDDVMLIEKDVPTIKVDDEKAHMKAKLLLFHDNYRPAYFGTWRKKSSHVGPRTPFKKDMVGSESTKQSSFNHLLFFYASLRA